MYLCFMKKAVIFDIAEKRKDQIEVEMKMDPRDRLLLCLSLMELSIAMSKNKRLQQNSDDLPWIELKMKNGNPNS
jgi:hypothetical protein